MYGFYLFQLLATYIDYPIGVRFKLSFNVPINHLKIPNGSYVRKGIGYVQIGFTATWEAVEHGNRKLIGVTSIYIFLVYGPFIFFMERLYLRLKVRRDTVVLFCVLP